MSVDGIIRQNNDGGYLQWLSLIGLTHWGCFLLGNTSQRVLNWVSVAIAGLSLLACNARRPWFEVNPLATSGRTHDQERHCQRPKSPT